MEEFNFDAFESYAKIVVIGVGGAGNNAVNQMIEEQIRNIDFWVCNTDAQALSTSKAEHKMVLGPSYTKGLGAGGNPEIGRKAAEDSTEDIKEIVEGADMVFIAAGMGGGTGTGAAPIIAKIAKEAGALTVAIVTRPFTFEGENRRVHAVEGITALKEAVDSIIIVSNDKLMMINGNRPLKDAFKEADKVLAQSVKTITDLISIKGIINLDFNDVKTILSNKGLALIGFGSAHGEKKAVEAATAAISSPLLEAGIAGAKSAIVNITCGSEVTMYETQDVISYITEAAGGPINIIFGVQQNSELNDELFVSVIATDFSEDYTPEAVLTRPIPTLKEEHKEIEDNEEEIKEEDESILPSFLKGHMEE